MSDQDNMDDQGNNLHPHPPDIGANEAEPPVEDCDEDTQMSDHGDNLHPPAEIGGNEEEPPVEVGDENTHMSEHIESGLEDHEDQRTDASYLSVTNEIGNVPIHNSDTNLNSDSGEITFHDFEDSHGRSSSLGAAGLVSDFEDGVEDDMERIQEEILPTIEQEELEHDAMDDVLDEEEDSQQQIEDDFNMTEAGKPPDVPVHAHDGEHQERDASAESTHSDQILQVQSVQHGEPAALQSNGVEEEDSSSLFIPEESPPAPKLPSLQLVPLRMPSSARPASHPTTPGNSIFAKIRNMQKAHAERKNAATKRANAHRHIPQPDNEAYLEAVMAPITPLSSTQAPEVSEEEMDARLALQEFQRQQRKYAELKRQNGGSLTFRQDVEWMQVRNAEEKRKRKYARDMAEQNAESEAELVPETYPSYSEDDVGNGDESDSAFNQSTSSSRKRHGRDMPRKEPKQFSMLEAEMQSMRVALEAGEDVPKKKKTTQDAQDGTQSSRTSSKSKDTKAKSKVTKSRANPKAFSKSTRKTAKSKREAAAALRQASSLFNANVFEVQAGDDAPAVPTFRTRNKQDALKELIASVPLEAMKEARGDMSTLLAATKEFIGHGACKADGAGGWLVRGMKTSLKSYQVLGSAFLRRRENAPEQPRGGLMADQMGLGKTLMMIANIVNGQPKPGKHPRTTLLVASPALLTQWAAEIQRHTDPKIGVKIMRYGSGTRIDSNQTFHVLQQHDYVLTTYNEVMKSYPKNEPPIQCQTAQQKIDWWKKTYETKRGILHRMGFLRIVLDEAQAIKNHLSRTSIACRALMAEHKWAMSGTPILNSLTELYPYFKFLNVPHTGSYKIFKHNYCDSKNIENTERLLSRLAQFMIRRTHGDRLFHAPILKLPQAAQGTFWCEFNPIERVIYEIVRQRFSERINQWRSNGELEKGYSNALVMLLRLRQLTAHVLMLQFVMRDLLEVEDIERIKAVVKEQVADSNTQPGRTIIAIRKQLEKHAIDEKQKAKAKADAAAAKAKAKAKGEEWIEPDGEAEVEDDFLESETESELDEEEFTGRTMAHEDARLGGSGQQFGKEYNFKPYLASLRTGQSWEKAKKKATCSYCGKTPKYPWIASCGHLICAEPCMERADIDAAEDGKSNWTCKACGKTPTFVQPCDPDDYDSVEPVAQGTRSRTAKKKVKKRKRDDREDIADDWLSLAGAEVLPSAKTLAIKAQILNWRKEDPKVKIIIYTQFLAM